MKAFEKTLRTRQILLGVLFAALSVFLLILNTWGPTGTHQDDMVHGFALGLSCGLLVLALAYTLKLQSALKDSEKLRKLYIAEQDERNRHIREKMGGIAMPVTLWTLMAATAIAGFFNFVVFVTLAGATLCVALIACGFKLYFRRTM